MTIKLWWKRNEVEILAWTMLISLLLVGLAFFVSMVQIIVSSIGAECHYLPEPSADDRRVCAPAASEYTCFSRLGYKYECK